MDGQLSADEHARVEAHLRTCHSCRDDLRTLRWTHDLLQEVVPVPIPHSFILREADVARSRQAWFGGRSLTALQWATALVAILLVLVVTGDVWISMRPSPGAKQPAISAMRVQSATDQVTVSIEAEVILTEPAQSESPTEPLQLPAAPTGEAMLAQEAPVDKAMSATTGPVLEGAQEESEKQPLPEPGEESPQLPTSEPQPVEQPEGVVADAPPNGSESRAIELPWMRAGWRAAEIGLVVLLVGLIIAVLWVLRDKKT